MTKRPKSTAAEIEWMFFSHTTFRHEWSRASKATLSSLGVTGLLLWVPSSSWWNGERARELPPSFFSATF